MVYAPWLMKDIGAAIAPAYGAISTALAAGAGDNTEVESAIIDRQALGNPLSCACFVLYTTTLTQDKTLTLGADLDHGDDSGLSDAAQYSTGVAAAVVATGDTGGSTEVGYIEFDVDLSGAKRYIRLQYTPDLSHTGTDTATLCGCFVFGGFSAIPA